MNSEAKINLLTFSTETAIMHLTLIKLSYFKLIDEPQLFKEIKKYKDAYLEKYSSDLSEDEKLFLNKNEYIAVSQFLAVMFRDTFFEKKLSEVKLNTYKQKSKIKDFFINIFSKAKQNENAYTELKKIFVGSFSTTSSNLS